MRRRARGGIRRITVTAVAIAVAASLAMGADGAIASGNDKGLKDTTPFAVGVAIDRTGALLVADDVGGCVWRVRAGSP